MLATPDQMPAGYRRSGPHAGLILPESVSRKREVWTRDEWKAMDRLAKSLKAHQVKLSMTCDAPECAEKGMTMERQPGGGMILRCACTERVFTRAF